MHHAKKKKKKTYLTLLIQFSSPSKAFLCAPSLPRLPIFVSLSVQKKIRVAPEIDGCDIKKKGADASSRQKNISIRDLTKEIPDRFPTHADLN